MVIKYRKPRAINAVSVSLVLLAGVAVYLGFAFWPAYVVSSRSKGVLLDNLPTLYRANLRGEQVAFEMIAELKKSVPEALRQAGVRDPELKVVFERNKKFVAMSAKFAVTVKFPFTNKSYRIPMNPRAETDAARVEW